MSHLKRKLDALKATLPDLDDSPIPSPSADAPSPTGSESPFHDMELGHPDLDVSAMDDEAEPPAPSPLSSPGGSPKRAAAFDNDDNRMVEDMELSDEEADGGIIGELRELLFPSVSSGPAELGQKRARQKLVNSPRCVHAPLASCCWFHRTLIVFLAFLIRVFTF